MNNLKLKWTMRTRQGESMSGSFITGEGVAKKFFEANKVSEIFISIEDPSIRQSRVLAMFRGEQ